MCLNFCPDRHQNNAYKAYRPKILAKIRNKRVIYPCHCKTTENTRTCLEINNIHCNTAGLEALALNEL